ncbi:MAG: gliding motility-associated ABC transporter substrate-binding protein GldG [Bacteroidetes bacterium]|nr:gliding motility-associated ABC transporter substrate-binding protein GldG [Bacteroidota bacterium]MBK9798610.1 gliding motility-associated ABC transporter substrate-binding protein GldG [Bacteroidota bacterium]
MNKKGTSRKISLLQLLLALVILVLINNLGGYVFYRIDLTSEKRYSLSPATKDLVKSLDDVVLVKVYLEGEFPAGFKRLRSETKEMLDEFRAYAGDNLQYEFINPSESTDEKKRNEVYQHLVKEGLQPTNLTVKEEGGKSQQIIFPGAIFSYKNRNIAVQLLKSRMGVSSEEMLNSSIQQLEYEFSNSIRKLSNPQKMNVAFIKGHGELDQLHSTDIARSLSEYYTVKQVALDSNIHALEGYDAAIVAKPDSVFSEKDKFILDQFVMNGGKMMWFIDPVYAEMDSLQNKQGMTFGISNPINLDDLLFKYGVRLNDNLVQDLQAAPIPIVTGYSGNQPQQSLFPWFYMPLVVPENVHPIVTNLNAIKFEFASSLDTVSNAGVKKTILLHTSKYSKVLNSPVRISLGIVQQEPKQEQYNKHNLPLAVLLEGQFESVFKNRITTAIANSNEIKFKAQSKPTKMIVVSDGDVIKNAVSKSSGKVYPLGFDRYTNQMYGNTNFILNSMNYLTDNSGLISIRSRELTLRLLDKEVLKSDKFFWQLLNTLLPILLLLIYGIVQFYLRKRKYSN